MEEKNTKTKAMHKRLFTGEWRAVAITKFSSALDRLYSYDVMDDRTAGNYLYAVAHNQFVANREGSKNEQVKWWAMEIYNRIGRAERALTRILFAPRQRANTDYIVAGSLSRSLQRQFEGCSENFSWVVTNMYRYHEITDYDEDERIKCVRDIEKRARKIVRELDNIANELEAISPSTETNISSQSQN